MKKNKIGLTALTVIVVSFLLLAANSVLGIVLMNQSRSAIRDLLNDEMSTIASVAAELIDGDAFRTVVEQGGDPSTEEYKIVSSTLVKLQKIVDSDREEAMEYIYSAVRRSEADDFIFVIDPDPLSPAPFGKNVVVTDALRVAGKGGVGIDSEPYSDEWGTYYSAYCPIFASNGEQVGIVGVDFNANYYSRMIIVNAVTVIGASVVSGIVGAVIVFLFTIRIRKRFRLLFAEFSSLADDIADLTEDYSRSKDDPRGELASPDREREESSEEEIGFLIYKIHHLQRKLRSYIAFVKRQAKTDPMTGVNNKTVYLEKVADLNRSISYGGASFCVAVFDINFLKQINDHYGHELGDRSIIESVSIMKSVFGVENLYRIGGDEFIAIMDGETEEEVRARFTELDDLVREYNETHDREEGIVSFSRGCSAFRPGEDTEYRLVFRRADEDLYRDKAHYHAGADSMDD